MHWYTHYLLTYLLAYFCRWVGLVTRRHAPTYTCVAHYSIRQSVGALLVEVKASVALRWFRVAKNVEHDSHSAIAPPVLPPSFFLASQQSAMASVGAVSHPQVAFLRDYLGVEGVVAVVK